MDRAVAAVVRARDQVPVLRQLERDGGDDMHAKMVTTPKRMPMSPRSITTHQFRARTLASIDSTCIAVSFLSAGADVGCIVMPPWSVEVLVQPPCRGSSPPQPERSRRPGVAMLRHRQPVSADRLECRHTAGASRFVTAATPERHGGYLASVVRVPGSDRTRDTIGLQAVAPSRGSRTFHGRSRAGEDAVMPLQTPPPPEVGRRRPRPDRASTRPTGGRRGRR